MVKTTDRTQQNILFYRIRDGLEATEIGENGEEVHT